jgi:hypothetical protein
MARLLMASLRWFQPLLPGMIDTARNPSCDQSLLNAALAANPHRRRVYPRSRPAVAGRRLALVNLIS